MLCTLFAHAEERDLVREMAENNFRIRQKPGTESLLKEYLNALHTDKDTIYAMLYEPSQCPRCEAIITSFERMMKSNRPDEQTVLISLYKDQKASERYHKKNRITADHYLYDTTGKYKDIFSFNIGDINGIIIMKLVISTGDMLTGGDPTVVNDEFIEQIIVHKDRLEQMEYIDGQNAVQQSMENILKSNAISVKWTSDIYKVLTDEYTVSSIYSPPYFDGTNLLLNERIENTIMAFTKSGNTLRLSGLIEADSTEKRTFIEISEEQYKDVVKNQLVFYIPLQPQIIQNGDIAVSYSLPNIFPDTISNTGGNAFCNKSVIVMRDGNTLATKPMFSPDFMIFTDTMFFYKHFSFSIFKGNAVYGCQKLTWPIEFSREEYEHIADKNPFCEYFYNTENPFIATFDMLTGKRNHLLGNLDKCHAKSFTGYWFTDPVSYSNGDELAYTDGYSNSIYNRRPDQHKSAKIYCIQRRWRGFSVADTAMFHKYEYIQNYRHFFGRRITSLRMDKNKVYCLVVYPKDLTKENVREDTYTLVTIDRHTGKTMEAVLPEHKGITPIYRNLTSGKPAPMPFGIYRNGDECMVITDKYTPLQDTRVLRQ